MSINTKYFETLFLHKNQTPKEATDTNIRHITINSCHSSYIHQGGVTPDVIEVYRPLLMDNLMRSPEEQEAIVLAGGKHPIPGSNGDLGILVSSDSQCGGNELSFTICLKQKTPVILAIGRCYDKDDGLGVMKWDQLVKFFSTLYRCQQASTWMGFDINLLLDPPKGPWLGVILTSAFDLIKHDRELSSFLVSVEQAIAVTWREICQEADSKAKDACNQGSQNGGAS